MALPCCGLGCVDDNVELCSSSGDPVGLPDTLARSSAQVKYATMLFKEPVFLGAEPTTSTLIRARSVVQVHPGPPVNTRLFSLFQFRGILPAKPFVNDLSTSGIAICRPRRHRRHHDLARGFTDCLNFLLTATAPRHSRNGKNINVHSRHIGLWKSSLQNQRSQIRGVTVIDTCVIWTIVRLIRDG
jgi:hypothetical protein